MTVAGLEDQVRAHIGTYLTTLESPDRAPLEALLAEDFIIVMGLGQVMDRAKYLASLDNFEVKFVRPRDLRITLHGGQRIAICTAVLEYLARRVREQPEFERVDLFHTMIWSAETGDWRLLLMQGTRTPLLEQA